VYRCRSCRSYRKPSSPNPIKNGIMSVNTVHPFLPFLPVHQLTTSPLPPENARSKGEQLFKSGCIVSEFGSRRRRTHLAHDIIIRGLIDADKEFGSGKEGNGGKLAGTSNVHFAQKYDLNPVGTIAHEWIMGIVSSRLCSQLACTC